MTPHTLSPDPALRAARQRLSAAAAAWPAAHPDEFTRASLLLFGGPPPPEHLADFLDFLALEWVDLQGWTLLDRLLDAGDLPPEAAAWRDVRTALWVVEGWQGDLVRLRDLAADDALDVHAPGLQPQLPRRMVLRARVTRAPDPASPNPHPTFEFSGDPDLVEPMGLLARLDLLRQWREGPEPALLARLAELRPLYRQMRAERAAWIDHFHTDLLTTSGPDDLHRQLSSFLAHTAALHPQAAPDAPEILQVELSGTLAAPGRHAVLYDAAAGIFFLPRYGELCDHLAGHAHHPDTLREYLEDPALPAEALRRAGGTGDKPPSPPWQVFLLVRGER